MSDELSSFYEALDLRVRRLSELHEGRLRCAKGCSTCCVDGITVFEVEADNIRRRNHELLSSAEPGPEGACAFLDADGACRIYGDRPYVCRTQGLPLRWLEETETGTVEYRDICPLNDEGEPVTDLDPDECWTIGEFEGKLAQIEAEASAVDRPRVFLRDLFNGNAGKKD